MESGNIVEFVDRQKIICAVVLEVKKQRLRLLTETNREVNLSPGRLFHKCPLRLELSMGRDRIVDALKEISRRRQTLIADIDIKELWEVLNTEQEWIDLGTMTEFCFPNSATYDHESAVVRAFFENRLYFKFNQNSFFPNSEELVERNTAQQREAARQHRIIAEGSDWLKKALAGDHVNLLQNTSEIKNILKSYYIFGNESGHYNSGKAMLAAAQIDPDNGLFQVLVKLGVFGENENIDLYRYDMPTVFSDGMMQVATALINNKPFTFADHSRKDLTMLPVMTIDGQGTLDYDDAISIEDYGDRYRLGVHIVDVGHYIKKGDMIDQEALARGSSIYMPDLKIPMLPPSLAEDL
ncbi:MAG: RNB domain-containing ribonuclease, partial [Proteobacteria bacterium]|nr:RNB domain-containing ribonuclease [Pseudomonadota bacterium]